MDGKLSQNLMSLQDARGVTKLIFTILIEVATTMVFINPDKLSYVLKIFSSEEVTSSDLELAVQRFRAALDNSLGDSTLVLPCYTAYRKLFLLYADHPRPWPVNAAEQLLVDHWEAAELAATQSAFGINRYLGDADFEIRANQSFEK